MNAAAEQSLLDEFSRTLEEIARQVQPADKKGGGKGVRGTAVEDFMAPVAPAEPKKVVEKPIGKPVERTQVPDGTSEKGKKVAARAGGTPDAIEQGAEEARVGRTPVDSEESVDQGLADLSHDDAAGEVGAPSDAAVAQAAAGLEQPLPGDLRVLAAEGDAAASAEMDPLLGARSVPVDESLESDIPADAELAAEVQATLPAEEAKPAETAKTPAMLKEKLASKIEVENLAPRASAHPAVERSHGESETDAEAFEQALQQSVGSAPQAAPSATPAVARPDLAANVGALARLGLGSGGTGIGFGLGWELGVSPRMKGEVDRVPGAASSAFASVNALTNASSKSATPAQAAGAQVGYLMPGKFVEAGSAEAGDHAKGLRSFVLKNMERVESALKEVARSRDGKTISVRLDPPELGSVKIDVSYRDGSIYARVVAESPQVGNWLRERAHELQAILRRSGLDVDQAQVSVSSEQGASASFGEFESYGSGSGTGREHGSSGASSHPAEEETTVLPTRAEQADAGDHWVA